VACTGGRPGCLKGRCVIVLLSLAGCAGPSRHRPVDSILGGTIIPSVATSRTPPVQGSVVAFGYRLDQPFAEPGSGEHGPGQDRAAHQGADLRADQRLATGITRCAGPVDADHPADAQALGPRPCRRSLRSHLQHRRPVCFAIRPAGGAQPMVAGSGLRTAARKSPFFLLE